MAMEDLLKKILDRLDIQNERLVEQNDRLTELADSNTRIERRLRNVDREGDSIMATLQDLIAEVARTRGISASVKSAVEGLKAKVAELTVALEAAIAAADPVAMQAVVDDLKATNAELDALAPAIVANP